MYNIWNTEYNFNDDKKNKILDKKIFFLKQFRIVDTKCVTEILYTILTIYLHTHNHYCKNKSS